MQNLLADGILLERPSSIAGVDLTMHQGAVDMLLQWIKVKQGARAVNSFLVYPEVKSKATAVVVIHENQGLTDWVRGVADQLAEAGYIAIAPDLLSGMAPGGGGTAEIGGGDAVRKAISSLPPDQITADAVAEALGRLLDEPSFREAATRLRVEIERMPPAAAVLHELLATTDQ